MNYSESRIPNGEASAGGSPRAPGRRPGNATRPRAFFGDTRGGMVGGICGLTLQLGHRVVRFPCGQGRNALHVRCEFETLARSQAPAPLHCPTANCGDQHPRRDALEAVVQAAPGLRNRARWMEGGDIGDDDPSSRGLWYRWDQNRLGIRLPRDARSLEDLRQRFGNGKKYNHSWQAHMRACVHVLGILNHALGEHVPNQSGFGRARVKPIGLGGWKGGHRRRGSKQPGVVV